MFNHSNLVNHMAAGGGHILLKTSNNHLFSCGWNSKGQLGNGTTKNVSIFKAISSKHFDKKSIVSLHCGWEESAMICSDGSLYVWGSNLYGQLGQPNRRIVKTPTQLHLPNNEKAISILSKQSHVFVIVVFLFRLFFQVLDSLFDVRLLLHRRRHMWWELYVTLKTSKRHKIMKNSFTITSSSESSATTSKNCRAAKTISFLSIPTNRYLVTVPINTVKPIALKLANIKCKRFSAVGSTTDW